MHQPPQLFHRDIRWPNVIYSFENRDWFLIDWEDASAPPTVAAMHMEKKSHAPNVFFDGHGAEVDIWAAGQLITDAAAEIPGLSLDLRCLGEEMKAGKITTAEVALVRLERLTL
jgi:hypothetical protein